MSTLFLGGTCNGDTWRERLIPKLNVSYYNPVVEDWTPECQAEEIRQRGECQFALYTITNKMVGVYSIAEVVDDSNKRPNKTLFCILTDGFSDSQLKSLNAVHDMVLRNGGRTFTSLDDVANYVNKWGMA